MAINSNSPYRPVLPLAIGEIAKQWANDIQIIRRSFSMLRAGTTFELRYEDLVADPRGRLAHLCDWLGEHFSPEMLQFYDANRIHHLEPAITMDWKRQTLKPINSDTVGRYATLLSESEVSEFVVIACSALQCYGYIGRVPEKFKNQAKEVEQCRIGSGRTG